MTDNTMTISLIGIPWYAKEDYPNILRVMQDAHVLPRSYAQWLTLAEQLLKTLADQRRIAVKVDLQSTAFVAWCKARSLNVDSSSRTLFANEHAAAVYMNAKH